MSERIAFLDVFVGISGDMLLGALVDVGLPLQVLEDTVRALGLEDAVQITAERVHKGAIAATKVTVTVHGEPDVPHGHLRLPKRSDHEHAHDAPHHHHKAHHHHEHPHHSGEHRSLSDVLALIESADLSPAVRHQAAQVFRRLAEAEARVHGIPIDKVHFHEVGALDAVVDVVGAVAGLHALGVTRVVASPVPLTRGYVDTAHGRLPVPAPATLVLLEGAPTRGLDIEAETVTPTGAALLVTLADAFGLPPEMVVRRVGHGAGTMDLPLPNVLRLVMGEVVDEPLQEEHAHTMVWLSTNVDDMPGEWFGPLFDHLFAAGALDVWFTPVYMKKGRPGVVINVLAAPERAPLLRRLLLKETTTLGVREEIITRWCLPRQTETVSTPWGEVRLKVALLPDGTRRAKPEFDDCYRLAREHNVSVREVYQAALAAFEGRET